LTTGDCFGWKSFAGGHSTREQRRSLNKVRCISFKKNNLLRILEGSITYESMKRLARMTKSRVWEVMHFNSLISRLAMHQKAKLQDLLEPINVRKGQMITKLGERLKAVILIGTGRFSVDVSEEFFKLRSDITNRPPKVLTTGAFVSDVMACFSHSSRSINSHWGGIPATTSKHRRRSERTLAVRRRSSLSTSRGALISPLRKSPNTSLISKARRASLNLQLYPQIMTIRAMEDGKVYGISIADSMDFFYQFPGVMLKFLGHLIVT